MPPVGSFRFINLNVDLFRLQKLLGNVVISQGGVVPHIAPVSCMIVVFLFVNLDLFSTLRNFCPQNRVNQRRTRQSARSFSSFHFYICTVHQGCILVIYYFFQLSNYMRFIEFFCRNKNYRVSKAAVLEYGRGSKLFCEAVSVVGLCGKKKLEKQALPPNPQFLQKNNGVDIVVSFPASTFVHTAFRRRDQIQSSSLSVSTNKVYLECST